MNDILPDSMYDKKKGLFVSVRSSYYMSDNGLIMTRIVRTLKRRSDRDAYTLEEEASNAGADQVFKDLNYLNGLKDGVYKVVFTSISRDWETGYVDDYKYELRRVEEEIN